MLITFHNVHDGRDQRQRSEVSFLEAEKVRGDLKIHFHGGQLDTYERRDVSVPLTVAEMKLFLVRLKKHGHATWRLFFAPFLDGKVENGFVRLMEGSRDQLSGKTVEVLSPESVQDLESKLDEFERRYGRLPPSEEADQSPGSGGG